MLGYRELLRVQKTLNRFKDLFYISFIREFLFDVNSSHIAGRSFLVDSRKFKNSFRKYGRECVKDGLTTVRSLRVTGGLPGVSKKFPEF